MHRVQGYGMTETNAYVCSVAGGDYLERVSPSIATLWTNGLIRPAREYRAARTDL